MEVLTVNPNTFLIEDLVEGYSSMIWTDRYALAGEFQLKTSNIRYTKELIPPGTLITLRDSAEICKVLTHSEGFDENGASELTVKGMSLSKILETRILSGDYKTPWEMQKEYTAQDALLVLIWNAVANSTTTDVTYGPYVPVGDEPPFHDVGDVIPNVVVTDSTVQEKLETPNGIGGSDLVTTKVWYVESGEVYSKVLDFMALTKLGLRLIRPVTNVEACVDVASDGTITKTPSSGPGTDDIDHSYGNKLRFDVYNGRNRTTTPSEYNPLKPVIYRYDAGHIETPTFLTSNEKYRNWAIVDSSAGRVVVWVGGTTEPGSGDVWPPVDTSLPPLGLDRLSTYIDLGDLVGDDIVTEDYLIQKGLAELKKQKKLFMMDGAISPNAPYQYGVDYFLGDSVTIVGQDGLSQDMQVTEYIRTEDADGDRGYPTLVSADI